MGIEGRDYYRGSSSYTERLGGWGWDAFPPVCKWIILITVAVYILQFPFYREAKQPDLRIESREDGATEQELVERLRDLTTGGTISIVQEWLELDSQKVLRGQVWRLLTTAFCHDRLNFWHIVMNMLFFYWFGLTLERMYGSREFVLFYLTAAVIASVAYVGLDLALGENTPAIGASGAVMAVTMLYAIHYPRHIIYMLWIIPVEVRWLVAIYVIYDLHPILLAIGGFKMFTGVAHAAHLGGLAFGFAYWKWSIQLSPLFEWLRFPRWGQFFGPRRKLRVYQPPAEGLTEELSVVAPHEDPDARVDEILRKLHEQGTESLTDEERQTLQAASRRYQKRNR
jgi:membrane associated rhomboid family serine protease